MGTNAISSFLIVFLIPFFSFSQEKSKGPIIADYGAVWTIDNPDFKVDTTKTYKAVFDIMNSPESHNQVNASIETAARFLNMHAQSGVPAENLKAALVVHNKASKDVISDAAYQKRFGTKNPNSELITALQQAGVEIIFCGQSSNARDFPKEDLMPGIQLSLSAMTALIHLQDQEYRLIKF